MKVNSKLLTLAFSLLLGLVYISLRLPYLTHPLTWDEGMNLLSLRSFLDGVDTPYSSWLTRHPPVYLIYLALSQNDFFPVWAARAVMMNIVLGVILLWVLFKLVNECSGKLTAWLSVMAYALMPGAIFFDVWIKRDLMTNLLGLAALLLFVKRKWILSGVLLGLALLTKLLAIVYILPIAIAVFLQREEYPVRKGGLVLGIACLFSAWWYVLVSDTNLHILSFVTGVQIVETESWHREGLYFIKRLPLNLGWIGLIAALTGCVVLLHTFLKNKQRGIVLWPLLVTLPYLLVLTVAKGKTPWLIIPALPAFAVLCGTGLTFIFKKVQERNKSLALICLMVMWGGMVWEGLPGPYDQTLQNHDAGTAWGALASTKAAEEINSKVGAGETFAVSPFNYWTEQPGVICPILLTCLNQWPDHRWPNFKKTEDLETRIKETKTDWVLLSPHPDEAESLLMPLKSKGAVFHILEGSILMDARNMKTKEYEPLMDTDAH